MATVFWTGVDGLDTPGERGRLRGMNGDLVDDDEKVGVRLVITVDDDAVESETECSDVADDDADDAADGADDGDGANDADDACPLSHDLTVNGLLVPADLCVGIGKTTPGFADADAGVAAGLVAKPLDGLGMGMLFAPSLLHEGPEKELVESGVRGPASDIFASGEPSYVTDCCNINSQTIQ